jgi:ADP-heptose:LPS heptosyltransferase
VATFTCCGKHGHLDPVTARGLASELIGLFTYEQYRRQFAADGQARLLEQSERSKVAGHIATYYSRSAPSGALVRTPQRLIVILPDDLRELIFALPAISGLRVQYPLSHLQAVVASEHARLLPLAKTVDQVLVRPRHPRDYPAFLRALCRPRADVCMAFACDFRSCLLAACTLAPHRLGFVEGAGSLFMSDHLHANVPVSPMRALTLTHALGIAEPGPVAFDEIAPAVQETVNLSLLAEGIEYTDRMILLCPDADEARAWPPNLWRELARLLLAQRHERIVLLTEDAALVPEGAVRVAPVHDTLLLAALLRRADLLIAADSGPLHLADAIGASTIGLYGPTPPEVCHLPNENRRPLCHREFPCHPCGENVCSERHCLRSLTPNEVADAVARHLDAPIPCRV